MSKPALKLEPSFRSPLEKKIAKQLEAAGIEYGYETTILKCLVPAREAKYKADFECNGTPIIIEGKGTFGFVGGGPYGRPRNDKSKNAEARQKLILIKQQNPGADIRIVFERAHAKLYGGCKTTNAQWCETHGFKWADKGTVPPEWIEEIKHAQHRAGNPPQPSGKKRAPAPRKKA